MPKFLFFFIFAWASSVTLPGQNCPTAPFSLIDQASVTVTADMECVAADGWVHYYDSSANQLLFSILPDGQTIGSVNNGLSVSMTTNSSYGIDGFDLSAADYIDNDFWYVTNRSWEISGAAAISNSVRVRWYFNDTDLEDIDRLARTQGFTIDEPEDIFVYTVFGNNVNPYSLNVQGVGGGFILYDQIPGGAPDWESGTFQGINYAEFDLGTLNAAGGGGFLIFVPNDEITLSGKVTDLWNEPLEDIPVFCVGPTPELTNVQGNYAWDGLASGGDFVVRPSLAGDAREDLSVLDLVFIGREIAYDNLFSTDYQDIAGDANRDNVLSAVDLLEFRQLVLGEQTGFAANVPWHFVPNDFDFSGGAAFVPDQIELVNVVSDSSNNNFRGIKIGNLAHEGEFGVSSAPPLEFYFDTTQTCVAGDTATLELKVRNFTNISGFQFTLNWDNTELAWETMTPANLPGLSNGNLGLFRAPTGELPVVWMTLDSLTLPDETTIATFDFAALGVPGAAFEVDFNGSTTEPQAVGKNLEMVNTTFGMGRILPDPDSPISGALVDGTNVSCAPNEDGTLTVNASGGAGNYTYQWSTGQSGPQITGLPVGSYAVTILDGVNCPTVLQNLEVVENDPITTLAVDLMDESCPGANDGFLVTSFEGGQFPYNLLWNTSETTPEISDLPPGIYAVEVTDANDCTETFEFEIEAAEEVFLIVDRQPASGANTPDGNLMIDEIIGGTAPYSFVWNTGQTTRDLTNVVPGNYLVNVTDANGCEYLYAYKIGFVTSTSGQFAEELTLFPNPALAKASITLTGNFAEQPRVQWVDALGRVLPATYSTTAQQMEVLTPNYGGVFYLEIFTKQARIVKSVIIR